MTIKELLSEIEQAFPQDAEVKEFKIKAKLKHSTRTLEGPGGVLEIEVKKQQPTTANHEKERRTAKKSNPN